MTDSQIIDNTALHRFELTHGDQTAFVLYTRAQGSLRLVHTEVPSALQGKGVGLKLVGGVLRLAKEQGLTVIPSCSFVADYLKRHQEYLSIIDAASRRMIEGEA